MLSDIFTSSGPRVAMPFRPVDVQALARKLKLEARGAADGRSGMPPATGGGRTAADQEIETEFEVERTRLAADLTSSLSAYRTHLAQLETVMDIAQVRQQAASALAKFQEVSAQWGGEMARLRRRATGFRDEYEKFRQAHNLDRQARQPAARLMTVAWLPTMVAIESVFNGMFFAEGSNLGLIGGVLIAVSLSAVNVLFGFLVGWGPARWASHCSWLVRLPGIVMTSAGVLAVLGFNIMIGHYRDAYESMGDAVSLAAVWHAAIDNPAGFIALASWLLLLMGCFFSGVGGWKGYRFDDPYPGYGELDRRRDHAEHEYASNRQTLLEETGDVRDECLQHLQTTIERMRGASTQHQQTLAARARMLVNFQAHEQYLEQAGAQLLTIYRDANRRERTAAEPQSFAQPFRFHDKVLDRPLLRELCTDPSPHPDAASLLDELDGLRTKVLSAYSAMLQATPSAEV